MEGKIDGLAGKVDDIAVCSPLAIRTRRTSISASLPWRRRKTLICPARPRGSEWALTTFGAPQIVSAGSVQRTIDDMVPAMFPQ
jgi:hypothetical protein